MTYTRQILAVYWQHMRPYTWSILAIFFMVGVNMALWTIYPLYYKDLFDGLVAMSKTGVYDWPFIKRIFVIVFSMYTVMWLFWRISGLMASSIQPQIAADLQNTVFKNVLDHSYRFFTEEPSGSLVKKASRFVDTFNNISEPILWRLFPLMIVLVTMFVVFWRVEPVLGAILAVSVFILLIADILVSRFKLPIDEYRSEVDSKAGGLLADVLTNAVNIKLFVSAGRERSAYRALTEDQRKAQTKSWRMHEVSQAIQVLLTMVMEFVIMAWAVRSFIQGRMSIGTLAILQTYLIFLFNQVWDFGRLIRTVYEQMANAKEMIQIMEQKIEIQDVAKAKKLKVNGGAITFERVSFSYISERGVLRDFSLHVTSGEKIALVGSSGAGKSTVTKLLLRFFDLTAGRMTIDGQDISKVTQDSLRANIALVPQDPLLFHRTLEENIRYGNPQASKADVVKAAKQAHCHDFISALPDGYASLVGERGVKLSGGERQRVAVARAILMNAPILILDEATSSLDSESEGLIQDALKKLMKGKTVIAIAHRLSTIMQMDRIIVMQDGGVIDEGRHEDLLTRDGLYKSLWSIQAGGFLGKS